ncbi:hypothetical protein [Aeromonas veronii]|uniref:hypothetical protein n=1 Tax=Aeromonas veronii TaxID=654 RepID=UPI0024169400|nr:hypothetical protein [Aeromonas veronii]WFO49859.1 hypothetical protein L1O00_12550 [Aeromonas veronii]
MKKTVVMAAILGAMGFAGAASAENLASHVFTWSGSVPAISTQTDFIIRSDAGGDIENGTLLFLTDVGGNGMLHSASTVGFNVFDYTGNVVGEPARTYSYELTHLAATKNGLVTEQGADGYYAINADGTTMVKGNAIDKPSGGSTVLTVEPTNAPNPTNQPKAGDDVAVHATIVITNAMI